MDSASPEQPPAAPGAQPEIPAPPADDFPDRYGLRERDGFWVLVGREAPGVALRLDRDFSFSETEARRLGERTILLDGAGAFGPLVDDSAHLYNLDHHQGCLRSFTLATCEQALILVRKGLELDKGEWTIYANEPDLDSLFAIWVLLNYRRVRGFSAEARDRIVPLLLLEGAIDANGFDFADYCGLPEPELSRRRETLDRLHRLELEARRRGEWAGGELQEFCRRMLREIDRIAFLPEDLEDEVAVEEEYGHVDIGQGRVAVVCRDSAGIYEVERRLKKIWGDRLGIVALEKEPGHFTLRRSAALAGIDLTTAYDRLNLFDPAVDGRPPGKKWGGSDDIGGSPRREGTGLSPQEIAKILKLAYKKPAPGEAWRQAWAAAGHSLLAAAAAAGAVLLLRFLGWGPADHELAQVFPPLLAGGVLIAAATLLTRRASRGWTWLYGWRRPAGWRWWPAAVALAGLAAAGAAWVPPLAGTRPGPLLLAFAALGLLAIGLEMVFRGLAHGKMVLGAEVEGLEGPVFLSRPTLVAALLFAGVGFAAEWRIGSLPHFGFGGILDGLLAFVLLFAAGSVAGILRERSLSIWPGAAAWALGGMARLGFELML